MHARWNDLKASEADTNFRQNFLTSPDGKLYFSVVEHILEPIGYEPTPEKIDAHLKCFFSPKVVPMRLELTRPKH